MWALLNVIQMTKTHHHLLTWAHHPHSHAAPLKASSHAMRLRLFIFLTARRRSGRQALICLCYSSLAHTRTPVTWLRGIRDVGESGRSYVEVLEGDLHRLVLKKASYMDSGTYIIKASNCHGSQKAYCTVRVCI